MHIHSWLFFFFLKLTATCVLDLSRGSLAVSSGVGCMKRQILRWPVHLLHLWDIGRLATSWIINQCLTSVLPASLIIKTQQMYVQFLKDSFGDTPWQKFVFVMFVCVCVSVGMWDLIFDAISRCYICLSPRWVWPILSGPRSSQSYKQNMQHAKSHHCSNSNSDATPWYPPSPLQHTPHPSDSSTVQCSSASWVGGWGQES